MTTDTLPPVLTVDDLIRRNLARALRTNKDGTLHTATITPAGYDALRANQAARATWMLEHPDASAAAVRDAIIAARTGGHS